MSELVLEGLDGANPLGFLAALGCLEALADHGIAAKLRFVATDAWRPALSNGPDSTGELVALLVADAEACVASEALGLEYDGKRDLKPTPVEFRALASRVTCRSTSTDRRDADWVASFGDELVTDGKGTNIKPSFLHFTAGQQQWLDMVHKLLAELTPADLERALVGPWTYQRATPVMGWDSTASRDFALRARDPGKEKKLGEPGADWLAVRGWVALRSSGVGGKLRTTGCAGRWKTGGSFRWPLWIVPLDRACVRSTIGLDWVAVDQRERAARGVEVVLSSGITRSDQGGYGSFDPSRIM